MIYLVTMGNSKGIVKMLYVKTISSQSSLWDEGSTTIESITEKKYLSEEVSRVGEIRNGEHLIFGNRV